MHHDSQNNKLSAEHLLTQLCAKAVMQSIDSSSFSLKKDERAECTVYQNYH